MIVHGDKAHSYYFGKDAYKNMTDNSKFTKNKVFVSVKGASHTDLYDNFDKIPLDKIVGFYNKYFK